MKLRLIETAEAILSQARAGKFLAFRLGAESYAIPMLNVREILRFTPHSAEQPLPDDLKGVINLRGKVIPVADLRRQLMATAATDTRPSCIIVVQVQLAFGNKLVMGLLADAVEDVIAIPKADIKRPPEFEPTFDVHSDFEAYYKCVLGMATVNGSVKVLLDIDEIVAISARKPDAQVNPLK